MQKLNRKTKGLVEATLIIGAARGGFCIAFLYLVLYNVHKNNKL